MQAKTGFLLLFIALPFYCISQCHYYYFQNNKTVTIAIYNRKGSQDGKLVYKVSGVKKQEGTTTAKILSEVYDKKGKLSGKGSGEIQCRGGQLMVDMKMMLSPQQTAQVNDAEVKGTGAYLEYPASINVGENLKAASFNMDMKMESGTPFSVAMDITDRQVQTKEMVTTPAGTWEAYKITYKAKTVVNMTIAIPVQMDITEWFVPDFGIVKSESKFGKTELFSIQ